MKGSHWEAVYFKSGLDFRKEAALHSHKVWGAVFFAHVYSVFGILAIRLLSIQGQKRTKHLPQLVKNVSLIKVQTIAADDINCRSYI